MASQLIPFYTNSNITLSGSNLTATQSVANNWTWSYGTPMFNSGKWYWEVTCGNQSSSNAPLVGLGPRIPGNAFSPSGNTYPGGSSNGGIGYSQSGVVYYNGSSIATGYPTYTTGNKISFAIDYANNNIWVRVNGGNWNGSGTADPATNTGGLSIATMLAATPTVSPGLGLYYASDAMTINFGDTAFTYTVPSGFSAVTGAPTYLSILSKYPNGSVASLSATFTSYRAFKGFNTVAHTQKSSTQASQGSVIKNAWYGGVRTWSPAGAQTGISGFVEEFAVGVSGKKVMLFDNTGLLLGTAVSGVGGAYGPIPALGRTQVWAVAFDPTSFQMLGFDRLTPG